MADRTSARLYGEIIKRAIDRGDIAEAEYWLRRSYTGGDFSTYQMDIDDELLACGLAEWREYSWESGGTRWTDRELVYKGEP